LEFGRSDEIGSEAENKKLVMPGSNPTEPNPSYLIMENFTPIIIDGGV
jgi:hypothetical protein